MNSFIKKEDVENYARSINSYAIVYWDGAVYLIPSYTILLKHDDETYRVVIAEDERQAYINSYNYFIN